MPDLFKEIVPSILETKKNVFDGSYSEYSPFIVNKALSTHHDCVFYVNEMNINHFLDKDIQYTFYLNSIRSMKRKFQKWHKADSLDNLEMVKSYFGYSNRKAKDALRVLTDEQISEIKTKTNKGGVK